MAIELLTFDVPLSDQAKCLQSEERHWSRFLERQPRFVQKQMWQNTNNPST